MKKVILLCFVSVIILTLLIHEKSCKHQFEIQNNSPVDTYKLYLTTGFEDRKWETKAIAPRTAINEVMDLNKFEGDLILEAENLERHKILRAYEPYVYQGDASNYIISINDNDLEIVDATSSEGVINAARFFFVSGSRYVGCLM